MPQIVGNNSLLLVTEFCTGSLGDLPLGVARLGVAYMMFLLKQVRGSVGRSVGRSAERRAGGRLAGQFNSSCTGLRG